MMMMMISIIIVIYSNNNNFASEINNIFDILMRRITLWLNVALSAVLSPLFFNIFGVL